MKTRLFFLLALMTVSAPAWALPPSSTLTGKKGKLVWTVTKDDKGVTITGTSPKWKVKHRANLDLTPIWTEHRDEDGTVRVDYSESGAKVTKDGEVETLSEKGLWDGDTVDVRLGQAVVDGKKQVKFHAVDAGGGKIYGFGATVKGRAKCGEVACTHVKLNMTGAYRMLGPSWEYWYGSDGKLLKFEGPIGDYTVSQ